MKINKGNQSQLTEISYMIVVISVVLISKLFSYKKGFAESTNP